MVLHIELTGAFLPFENVYVAAVTKYNTRLGAVPLTGSADKLPDSLADKAALLKELHDRRAADPNPSNPWKADISMPDTLAPDDIVGFELTRAFRPFIYSFPVKKDDPIIDYYKSLGVMFPEGGLASIVQPAIEAQLSGVTLNPDDLEQELGGPYVSGFTATAKTGGGTPETYSSDYISSKTQLPTGVYPIPARQVQPYLRYKDVLKIERTLQYVVRNTITYSKMVWNSLTPEERAIMLEGYTIGVPKDGLPDETQHFPLLNCVANQVLGYFGNAMIMPFTLPPVLDNPVAPVNGDRPPPLTTGQIQDALTNFHRTGFSPPVSHIVLPTHGVLGEAVLGQCPSAEKIDLTRFWNWADSPIDKAPDLPANLLGHTNLLAGAAAPDTLSKLAPIINNVNAGAAPSDGNDLLKSLIAAGASQKDFSDSITGADKLAALVGQTLTTNEQARKDALATAQNMATKTLDKLPDLIKAESQGKAAAKKEADDAKKARDGKVKAAVDDLHKNAATYKKVAANITDDDDRQAYATKVVTDLAGEDGLPAAAASKLFDDYKDSPEFLTALGLPSE
jgi:hypothetical protein